MMDWKAEISSDWAEVRAEYSQCICFQQMEAYTLPRPKLRWLRCFHSADLGFYGLTGMTGVYVRVRGIGAPIRSKARRWSGVGLVSLSTGWPATVMVSRVRVARWSIRSRKLRMGCFPGPVLRPALAAAAAERRTGVTGLPRAGGFSCAAPPPRAAVPAPQIDPICAAHRMGPGRPHRHAERRQCARCSGRGQITQRDEGRPHLRELPSMAVEDFTSGVGWGNADHQFWT